MTADDARAAAAPTATQTVARTAAPGGLVLATACPRCGAAVPSEASDFCEGCSAHLYPGHCVFCLEEFAPGQAYCRRCGLPPEGVVCGACGTFSRFDFCPSPACGAGLTPRAAAELARLDSDPEVADAFAELDEIGALIAAVETGTELPPPAPPAMVVPTAVAATVPAATVAASPAAAAPRPSLAALRAAAQGARSAEEKARVRALAELAAQDSLNAVASRSFPTAQEARAAGTALQVALRYRMEIQRLETVAWRCNRFGCEHPEPGGMSHCADPSGGGVPIMRVITEIGEGSAEFTV